ncbi:MAG: radical SAM protein, partial [Deltaproteobacteria bacterium]|nr:radical SAM protein [Deltaproteobacteria bacterium]
MDRAYLRLSVTDRCNLRCAYCVPRGRAQCERDSEPLGIRELAALAAAIDRAAPVYKLRMTGGEPLVRPELADLVRLLRASLPRAELCLTTNGLLLRAQAPALREAGLDRINVSMDACDGGAFAAITGGAALDKVLDGVRAAHEAGFGRVRLNAVLLRTLNLPLLARMVRTAADLGCEMRFIELMKFGPGAALFAAEYVPAAEAISVLSREFIHEGEGPLDGTARWAVFRDGARSFGVGFIASVSRPFCHACDRVRLDSRGRLHPCLRDGAFLDCATLLRSSEPGAASREISSFLRAKVPPAGQWTPREMVSIGG